MTKKTQTALSIIRRKEVESRTGLSRSAIYARLRFNPKRPADYDPSFPRPVRIGARAVGWVEAEIEAWLRAQVERSRTERGGAR
jgi:prophage regulatory protein